MVIVDDSSENIHMLMETLGDGYRLIAAKNGISALKKIRLNPPPDLVLLDIMMPEMSGYEVLDQLQKADETRNIPVIFITSKNESTDETKGFELGAVDYITKPFVPAVVKARVRTHVQLKKKTDLLANLANLDGLTGLLNRRRIDQILESEWERYCRGTDPLSLLIIDIDHFKLYNDTYGHARGDECLKKIASALQRSLSRRADTVGRFGGEEFVVILPQTGGEGATHLAEGIVKNIEALQRPHVSSTTSPFVTISCGGITLMPGGRDSSIIEMLDLADRQLYKAKGSGRNCYRMEEIDGKTESETSGI